MELISNLAVPVLIGVILITGLLKKVSLFDVFIEGVKQGISSTLSVAPALIALVSAVTILRASGAMDLLCGFIKPVTDSLGIPAPVVPLCLMRPISGSGSTALLNGIFTDYGPDSLCGKVASIISGSTETTFYAIAVYYGAVGIKNTKYTVPAALAADLTGMFFSVFVAF